MFENWGKKTLCMISFYFMVLKLTSKGMNVHEFLDPVKNFFSRISSYLVCPYREFMLITLLRVKNRNFCFKKLIKLENAFHELQVGIFKNLYFFWVCVKVAWPVTRWGLKHYITLVLPRLPRAKETGSGWCSQKLHSPGIGDA